MEPFDPFQSTKKNEDQAAPFSPFTQQQNASTPTPYSPFSEPLEQSQQTAIAEQVATQAVCVDDKQTPPPFTPYIPQIVNDEPAAPDQPAVAAYQPNIISPERKVTPAPATVDNAFSAFDTGEMSVKEKARHVVMSVFGKDCVHETWFDFLLSWTASVYKDGESAVKQWLVASGDRNQSMHDRVTDLHRDYDLLDAVESIANAHKMMSAAAEKKWFKRSTIDPDKLEAHLAVVRQSIPPMQARLTKMLDESRSIMRETQAVNDLSQRNRSEFELRALHLSAERICLLYQSVSLLVPDLLLLEKELSQQSEDIETLVTITLPLWRRTQKN